MIGHFAATLDSTASDYPHLAPRCEALEKNLKGCWSPLARNRSGIVRNPGFRSDTSDASMELIGLRGGGQLLFVRPSCLSGSEPRVRACVSEFVWLYLLGRNYGRSAVWLGLGSDPRMADHRSATVPSDKTRAGGASSENMSVDIQKIKDQVLQYSDQLERVKAEVRKALIGQDLMLSRLLIALLTGGHVLLEGVPGLAKTTAIKALAAAIHCKFNRIQFTPDLLPADLIGTLIYNPREGAFSTRKGPIFANLILADEINRAPSKVQSALLEAMQEHQVTIGDESFTLDEPFLVLATQNPIEQEGTYPLPEAQVDRFMLKVVVGYPSTSDERKVVDVALDGLRREVQPVLSPAQLADMKQTAASHLSG